MQMEQDKMIQMLLLTTVILYVVGDLLQPKPTVDQITMYQLEYVQNVTFLLDNLLKGYDKSIRPNSPLAVRQPTNVFIDMDVRSMGPISEVEMAFSLDCYFRQTWQDERLRFTSSTRETLSLGVSMLDKIWKPDTYFWNGQDSYLHLLTTPNKFVRLSKDGTVHFSSRLTIKAKCPMSIHRFPLDVQKCPLRIGSFAYSRDEMIYRWKKGNNASVTVSPHMKLSQFSLDRLSLSNGSNYIKNADFSVLEVYFVFHRHAGYFLINFYGPCTLIVILSWVAFWINREATADRIALGVTSMLTMTFLFLDSRSDLPRVTYPTALDIYLILCFSFVMGTILEFSVVHGFTKYGTGDAELAYIERERLEKQQSDMYRILADPTKVDAAMATLRKRGSAAKFGQFGRAARNGGFFEGESGMTTPIPPRPDEKSECDLQCSAYYPASLPPSLQHLGDLSPYMPKQSKWVQWYHSWSQQGKKADEYDTQINSVSRIDRAARFAFPFVFAVVSALYWRLLLQPEKKI